MISTKTRLTAGARVKIKTPGPVPAGSSWDCDGQRTSTSVKRKMQQLFFKGDKRISGQVVYISRESERVRLKRDGNVKVEIRDAAGVILVLTTPADSLTAA